MEKSCLVVSGLAEASVTLMAGGRVNTVNSGSALLESVSVS